MGGLRPGEWSGVLQSSSFLVNVIRYEAIMVGMVIFEKEKQERAHPTGTQGVGCMPERHYKGDRPTLLSNNKT
eukprot:1161603-Pelagomonas_calceolata.AAC.23